MPLMLSRQKSEGQLERFACCRRADDMDQRHVICLEGGIDLQDVTILSGQDSGLRFRGEMLNQ
jgi:hypothetical protein